MPLPWPRQRALVTVADCGSTWGEMRDAAYPFLCIGSCGQVCTEGTLAQPFRDIDDKRGRCDEWQRMCSARYVRMRARPGGPPWLVCSRAGCCGRMRARVSVCMRRATCTGNVGYAARAGRVRGV